MQDINVLAKTRIKSFARVSTLSELALKHCCNNDCNPLNAKCNPMTINVVQMTKKNWGSVRIFSCSNITSRYFLFAINILSPLVSLRGRDYLLAGYLRVAIYPFIHGLGDSKRDVGDVTRVCHVSGSTWHVSGYIGFCFILNIVRLVEGVTVLRLKIKLHLADQLDVILDLGKKIENRKTQK